jgi:hypothetical protein
MSNLPELPSDYHWQLITEDRRNCTDDYLAECDAVEARIWCENGDPVLVLKRTGDFGYWGPGGVDGEGGLRKWTIEGHAPEGLMDWEQFETLSQITYRITLFTEENA